MITPTIALALLSPSLPPEAPASEAAWARSGYEPVVQEAEEAAEAPAWHGSVSLGLFQSSGNTERSSANLLADAELRREKDRTTLGAFWSFAEEQDDAGESNVTERRMGANAKYDYFLTEKSYALANASAEKDDQAALQLRYTVGLGYGRQFREDEDYKLSAEIGLNYFDEDYEGASPDGYVAARVAYNVDWVPAEDWTFAQTGEAYPSVEDSEDVYTKLDTRLRYDVSEAWFGQFQWVWDYDNTPAAGLDRSDHRLFLTVGYSF